MANDLPTEPHDPRWLPSRSTAILIGIGIQLLFVGIAATLIVGSARDTGPLVHALLIPEDLVFPDTDLAPQAGKQRPPIDVQKMAVPTDGQLEKGNLLFAEHCASCHGAGGAGNGPAGVALQPPPRDLTSLAAWKQGTRFSDLYRTLSLGLPGTQMPAFDYLGDAERFALAHHVAGLAPERPSDTEASLDSLDAEFELSTGTKEPNIVPLSTAMDRLVSEEIPTTGILPPERETELSSLEPQGAAVFAQIVRPHQLERVSRLLLADASWRNDSARLQTIAVNNLSDNGFDTSAAMLSRTDWSALNRYLTLRFEGK
jgi:mono/diheme cytochrome c family protein